ncbi:MAG: transglycosylase SLT domain-containing protein, partial [Enterovibrio sp.]
MRSLNGRVLKIFTHFASLFIVFFTLNAHALDYSSFDEINKEIEKTDNTFSLPVDEMEGWLKPWKGDFDGILKRRVIRVLTTNSKTFYFVDKGVQRGITYDSFMEFERSLNASLLKQKKLKQKHLKIRVIFIPVARDELLQALIDGKGDIAAANLTITPERQKLVDFSTPLQSDVAEWVIASPQAPKLNSVNDLSGKEVFVRASSSYYQSLIELNKKLAAQNLPPVILKEAPEVLEDEDLIEMVNVNLASYIIMDSHKAEFWIKIFPKTKIYSDFKLSDNQSIAWAVRKGSPQLIKQLNEHVKKNGKGSKTGNVILKKYLSNVKYISNPDNEVIRKRFVDTVQYFQRYGSKYDVDWLLMMAQGYQESRLNQAKRSRSGAIGVMQVMPATGKDMNVGDIKKIEPNIHAGIKYVRWMITHYYKDQPMTDIDKALFAFASYNAGPGKISKLRNVAK